MKFFSCRCMHLRVTAQGVERSPLVVGEPDLEGFSGSSGAIRVGELVIPVYGADPGQTLETASLALVNVDRTANRWAEEDRHPTLLASKSAADSRTALVLISSEIGDVELSEFGYYMEEFAPDGNSCVLAAMGSQALIGLGASITVDLGGMRHKARYDKEKVEFEEHLD